MSYKHYKKEDIIVIVVQILKDPKSLPFTIPTKRCPNLIGTKRKKSRCKKHHGEYMITEYDKAKDSFLVRSYPIHSAKYDEAWFSSHTVLNKIFMNCLKKKYFTINDVKQRIDFKHVWRRRRITFRVTQSEYDSIIDDANSKEMTQQDYIRGKILD